GRKKDTFFQRPLVLGIIRLQRLKGHTDMNQAVNLDEMQQDVPLRKRSHHITNSGKKIIWCLVNSGIP
ncbi:hypothetical protein N9N82_12230, partial [Luminiphilus sp.]|nr:hypothetical protein [Luminiphilus sp.]